MMGLVWIEVTDNGGKNRPVRVEDIDKIEPFGTGSRITWKDRSEPLAVTQTAEAVGDLIYERWNEYTTALGDPA
jgi:hypothetical protein